MSEVLLDKERRELEEFDESLVWFQDKYEKGIKKKYKGEYVAIKNKRIVGHDHDASRLMERLKVKYKGKLSSMPIEYVSEDKISFIL